MMANGVEEPFSLGLWIRRRRKALDLTQGALAQDVGCAEVTIRKIEADVTRPSRIIAERLARCLHLAPNDQAVFLQVARGIHSADDLPSPLVGLADASLSVPAAETPGTYLPVDLPLLPAPLPPGSRMPLRRNPLFTGREQALRRLVHLLNVEHTAAAGQIEVAAVTGLGGIGKTQLACEFVHRYGQCFPGGVFWLSFRDPAMIPAEVAACGGLDGMRLSPGFDALPLNEQVRWVLTAWKDNIPRLLVFDNCEEEDLLDRWQPRHGGCRVLITSRRHHWNLVLGVQPVPLDVLPRGESLALLRTFRPDLPENDADLAAIANTLGDLPLALHLAGNFLAHYRQVFTPADYLNRLQVPGILNDSSLSTIGISPTGHVQHVARTFEQSYERLNPVDPTDILAIRLLFRASCCAPGEPIPRWLLLRTISLVDVPDALFRLEDALTRLINLGLLETDDVHTVRLHRLLVAFVRTVAEDTEAMAAVETAILHVAEALNQTRDPRPMQSIATHLHFVAEAAQSQANVRAAGLAHALGIYQQLLGAYAEARRSIEQALAIRQQALGMEHLDTARSLNSLSRVLREEGNYTEARRYVEQALAIRRRLLGTEHIDTALSLNDLGGVLWVQGNYAQAQQYMEQALATRRRLLGTEHIDTALSLHNLGLLQWEQGNYAEARGFYEQAVTILEHLLGREHPARVLSLASLGRVLWEQGAYAEAQRCLEEALAIRERLLGREHPDTAWCLHWLGMVLQEQGAYVAARRCLEEALAIHERLLGREHPVTARCLSAISTALRAQGDYTAAQAAVDRALTIQERVLGEEHPDTARSLTSLSEIFYEQGDYTAAQAAVDRALAIQERVLGEEHPDTARSLTSCGLISQKQGDLMTARYAIERATTIFLKRLGPQHPKTLAAQTASASIRIESAQPDTEASCPEQHCLERYS